MDSNDRLLDLLVARATEGLSVVDSDELVRALGSVRQVPGQDALDLAAAAVYLAYAGALSEADPMPTELKQRIRRNAPGTRP